MSRTDSPPELDLEKVEDAGSRGSALDFPRTWVSDKLEAVLDGIGWVINWFWIALVLIIVGTVLMRHFVGGNTIAIEETQWHIFAIGYLIGVGYAIRHDSHVRVDVLAMNFRPRTRAIIEALGIVLLIFPVIFFLIPEAINFTVTSLRNNEVSSSPGGLANRWAIKGVLIIALMYLGLAAASRLIRVVAFLYDSFRGPYLARPAQLTLNTAVMVAVVALLLTPPWRLYLGAAPPARDVERLVAQHYDLRRLRSENVSCGGALPFSFERVEPTETTVWAKPWRCTIEGVDLSDVAPDRRVMGAPIPDDETVSAEVLVGWLFPRGGRRSGYELMSDPDSADLTPDMRRLGAAE